MRLSSFVLDCAKKQHMAVHVHQFNRFRWRITDTYTHTRTLNIAEMTTRRWDFSICYRSSFAHLNITRAHKRKLIIKFQYVVLLFRVDYAYRKWQQSS